MTCEHARELLYTGPGALNADEQARLAAHLATCQSCRAEQQQLALVDRRIQQHAAQMPVRGMKQARAAVVRARSPRQHWKHVFVTTLRGTSRFVMPLVAVLSVVFALVAVVPFLHQQWANFTVQSANVVPTGRDRLWLESVSTPALAQTNGMVPVVVTVGYNLASTREGVLSLRLLGEPADNRRYFVEPVRVRSSETQAVVRFTVDAARVHAMFGNSPVHIEAMLRASTGDHVLLTQQRLGALSAVTR